MVYISKNDDQFILSEILRRGVECGHTKTRVAGWGAVMLYHHLLYPLLAQHPFVWCQNWDPSPTRKNDSERRLRARRRTGFGEKTGILVKLFS